MAEWLERNRANLAAVLLVLVAVAAFAVLQLPSRPALQVQSSALSGSPPPIKVHVVGAVLSPGVYQLAADARVEDALKAAGGPSESADLKALNLATLLRDGQQVVIAESPPASSPVSIAAPLGTPMPPIAVPSSTPNSGKIELNSASRLQLESLPGIGPVTAQKILDYRAKQGRIVSIEELRDAKLVNAPTYERIREMVEVR